jgi:hypothetical protein
MSSLSSHLTAGPDDSRLRLHPDCPVCCEERLAGPLSYGVLPARARVGLLAAALGAGTLVPSPLAAANSREDPPAAKASQAPSPAPMPPPEPVPTPVPEAPSPGGAETEEAPVDEAPQIRELLTSPEAGTDTQGEDVSGEDEHTTPAPAPLGQAPAEPTPVEPAPTPLGQPPAPPPPVEPTPAPTPPPPTSSPQPPPAPVDSSPAAEVERPPAPHGAGPRVKHKAPERGAKRRRPAAQPVPQGEAVQHREAAPPPADTVVPRTTTTKPFLSEAPKPASSPITDRSYTVQPGDNLWSIARRLVGPGASAGQIAHEVERLWKLNRDRIGTGDASLIYAGTVLRLA